MNVISYLYAHASRICVALVLLAAFGFSSHQNAYSQLPTGYCFPQSWYQNYNGQPGAITNVTMGALNNSTSNTGVQNNNLPQVVYQFLW